MSAISLCPIYPLVSRGIYIAGLIVLTTRLTHYSVVISVFAIVILSIIGGLFRNNHHEFLGGAEDPKDGQIPGGRKAYALIKSIVSPMQYIGSSKTTRFL